MESMRYQPPLRGAVLFLIGMNQGAVSPETIAEIACTPVDRAKAFAGILVRLYAIKETPTGYVRGRNWNEWSRKPTRSRQPKALNPEANAEMDAMRRAIAARVRHELVTRGWSCNELARRAGINPPLVTSLLKYAVPPPACQLVLMARTLGKSVEEMATPLPV